MNKHLLLAVIPLLLAACFEHGAKLTRFDSSPPTLHEVFVVLAGGDAGDAEP